MSYASYLKELLAPLRLYDLESGAGAEELSCIGEEMDRILASLELAEREALLATAETAGLDAYESLLPFAPLSEGVEERRQAIAALLRLDHCSFTVQALNDTAAGCGIPVLIREGEAEKTIEVYFPGVRGEPENLEALQKRLERILPCHLAIAYCFVFLRWMELEASLPSFTAVEATGSWTGLETYQP